MTVRHFLSSLNDFSLINPKILTVKEVIEIISKENPIIYDSENSYNLGLEVRIITILSVSTAIKIGSFHFTWFRSHF